MALPNKVLHIRFPEELIVKIDALIAMRYVDRTEFIRQAVVEKMRNYSTNVLPPATGLNILMTDQQLKEMDEIIRLERRRRNIHYWPH